MLSLLCRQGNKKQFEDSSGGGREHRWGCAFGGGNMLKKKWVQMAIICLFLSACAKTESKGTTENGETLLTDASAEARDLDVAQASSSDEFVLRHRFVRVKFEAIKRIAQNLPVGVLSAVNSKIVLNAFDNESIEILIDQAEKVSENNIILTGTIGGDLEGSATLVINDGAMVANIRHGDRSESYEVRHVERGIHTVALRKDEEFDDIEVENSEVQDINEPQDLATAVASPLVDILGAYTPNARSRLGGTSAAIALIQTGIADTNRALQDSGVAMRVRLVGTLELRQNETGAWSSDLSSLKGKYDGRWDEVHLRRTALGADQVSVVGYYSGSSTAGIGYIGSTFSSAFTIVKSSAFSQYTFSHELGHNLGLQHSDGYVNSAGRFRTIIAYGSYPRIRRYSNPNLTYNGYRTGDYSHNEAKIINGRASYMSGFSISK
jgi:hypothetical protein